MSKKELSLKEKAYATLKAKIVSCELQPGEDISEEQLANELGSSRTPIREALLKLQGENLVNIYPRKGSFVAPITARDIKDIYQIREVIEVAIAKDFCHSMPEEKLLSFRDRFEAIAKTNNGGNSINFFELDLEFHKYIVSCSGNQYLTNFIDNIYDKDYRVRVLLSRVPQRGANNVKKEHLKIIHAFLERDMEKIDAYLTSHIRQARDAALEMI